MIKEFQFHIYFDKDRHYYKVAQPSSQGIFLFSGANPISKAMNGLGDAVTSDILGYVNIIVPPRASSLLFIKNLKFTNP